MIRKIDSTSVSKTVLSLIAIFVTTSCNSWINIDLHIPVTQAVKNAVPVHIKFIGLDSLQRSNGGKGFFSKNRSIGDLLLNSMTKELHKKGYRVAQDVTGSHQLTINVQHCVIRDEVRSSSRSIGTVLFSGLTNMRVRNVSYGIAFYLKTTICGAAFSVPDASPVENKVFLYRNESYTAFCRRGIKALIAQMKITEASLLKKFPKHVKPTGLIKRNMLKANRGVKQLNDIEVVKTQGQVLYSWDLSSANKKPKRRSVLNNISCLRGKPFDMLNLSYTQVQDINILRGMPLKKLNLSYSGVMDIDQLRGMKLHELSLAGTGVTNIRALQGMKLQELSLAGTDITRIDSLRGMPLRKLDLKGTMVSDVSVLKGMSLLSINLPPTAEDYEFLRTDQKVLSTNPQGKKIKVWMYINSKRADRFWREYDRKQSQKTGRPLP